MRSKLPCPMLEASIYSADLGFIVIGMDEKILLWNDWMEKHSGVKEEDAISQSLTSVFSLNEDSKINKAVKSALSQGKSSLLSPSFEPHHLPLFRKTGKDAPMTQRIVARPQKVDGIRYCFLEITDQSPGAEREKHLQNTKDYIGKVIDSIQDIMIIIDKDHKICEVNQVTVDLLQYQEKELVGMTFMSLFAKESERSQLVENLADRKKPLKDFELHLNCKDGSELIVILSGAHITSRIHNKNLTRFVAIAKDITARRRAEELLVAQKAQLAAASKLSALGEMAGGVAHEINNPVAIIHGLAYRLNKVLSKQGTPKDNEAYQLLREIEETSTRITKIIKGLKAFSRSGEQDDFMPAPLKSILDDTLNLCSESFKMAGITLTVGDFPQDLVLDCRQIQISQVLLNLLNNAKDAIAEVEDPWIKLEIRSSDEKVLISVEDSGSGIDDETVTKLFQPFFTTKPAGKGTGLGLSISKGLIEDHNGRFYYDSTSPHTKFVILLPIKQRGRRVA